MRKDKNLPIDVHERTSVSRIAHYLANIIEHKQLFKDNKIVVDVEYNRSGSYIKTLLYDKRIYPDLIVHQRGNNEYNILICEFKNKKNSRSDKSRIQKMVNESFYGYLIGTTIIFKDIRRNAQDNVNPIWIERCGQIIAEEKRK